MATLQTVFKKLLDSVSQPSIDIIEREIESKYNSGSLLDSLLLPDFRRKNADDALSILSSLSQSNPLIPDESLVAITDEVAFRVVEEFENGKS